jgi:hypothetical protein
MNRTEKRNPLLLWIGLLGGPLTWLIQFEINYILVRWACSTHQLSIFHIISGTFLILALATAMLSWFELKHFISDRNPNSNESITGMYRFMAILGILSSVLFGLLILSQAIPVLIIDPCFS